MGKIWLKSVDPSKQCCGCEGKAGPCDSCTICYPLIIAPQVGDQIINIDGLPTGVVIFNEKFTSSNGINSIFANGLPPNGSLSYTNNTFITSPDTNVAFTFQITLKNNESFRLKNKLGTLQTFSTPIPCPNTDNSVYTNKSGVYRNSPTAFGFLSQTGFFISGSGIITPNIPFDGLIEFDYKYVASQPPSPEPFVLKHWAPSYNPLVSYPPSSPSDFTGGNGPPYHTDGNVLTAINTSRANGISNLLSSLNSGTNHPITSLIETGRQSLVINNIYANSYAVYNDMKISLPCDFDPRYEIPASLDLPTPTNLDGDVTIKFNQFYKISIRKDQHNNEEIYKTEKINSSCFFFAMGANNELAFFDQDNQPLNISDRFVKTTFH